MDYYPTIRQLQYLTALADQRSFSKAADLCHVTQSTLSAGIKELETLLGKDVVDRSQKKLALTAFGKTVLTEAKIILSHAGQITARARALSEPLTGPLRLGIIPTIAPFLLPDILPKIQKKFPALDLQLTEDQSARVIAQLKDGQLDLVLIAFPYDTPGMTQTLLFEEDFYLACPKGSWQGKTPIRMDDLKENELLLLEEGHCLRDHALAACSFQAKTNEKTFNATSLATLIQFVQHGYGITMLPAMAAKPGSVPKNIDILPFAAPRPQRKVGMVWRQNHPQEKEFSMLTSAIKEMI